MSTERLFESLSDALSFSMLGVGGELEESRTKDTVGSFVFWGKARIQMEEEKDVARRTRGRRRTRRVFGRVRSVLTVFGDC
jgi:hypothetical protein